MRRPASVDHCQEGFIQAQICPRDDVDRESNARLYWLDMQYRAFANDINFFSRSSQEQLEQTRRMLSRKRFYAWEKYEIKNGSNWKGTYLRELNKDRTEFVKDLESRYRVWIHMHHGAIDALEAYFLLNRFATDKDRIRDKLLILWNFLPQEFCRYGTGTESQERQVKRLMRKTDLGSRRELDEFLESLVSKFCSHDDGQPTDRIPLFEGGVEDDSESVSRETERDKLRKDMVASGAYQTLVKRQLLQTPLLLWPAVFKSGVSPFLEDYVKPCEVYYSANGELVVLCLNMQLQGGYEVYALWQNLLTYEDLVAVKRCTRACELRWEQVPYVPHQKSTAKQNVVVADDGTKTKTVVWRPKLRHFNAF